MSAEETRKIRTSATENGYSPSSSDDVMMVDMDIVEFLEARIAEQESAIREGPFVLETSDTPECEERASLAERMLDECAQKRAIIASWQEAAAAEGVTDRSEAEGTVAIARRSMLTILAGSHRGHRDYDPGWSPDLPSDVPGASSKA
jgi:hypothetical protein